MVAPFLLSNVLIVVVVAPFLQQVCMFIQLKFLNNGLRLFDVLFVLPIYQAFWITGAVSLPSRLLNANCPWIEKV